jgi:exodeoxyribonuclease V alpha subunit
METISGTIERITFYNEDSGYTVLKLSPDKKQAPGTTARDGTVTIVGTMPALGVGESVNFSGDWFNDPKYGLQFRAEMVEPVVPTSEIGIINYLSSGIVKGIGPITAERIVKHFGLETLDILDREPYRIEEVPGLKTSLARSLQQAWSENQAQRQTLIFLQGYGLSSRMAKKITDVYGSDTVRQIKEDPYRLANEVFGIGFIKADAIAVKLGLPPDSPQRLRAGLSFALNRLALDGHTYAPRTVLVNTAVELLKVDKADEIDGLLNHAIFAEDLFTESIRAPDGSTVQAIYLPAFYHAERGATEHLRLLAKSPSVMAGTWRKTDWPAFLSEVAQQNNVALTPQQQGAVQAALTSKVSVLTGGPGTGKTTTLQMVIHALEAKDRTVRLASPTGRAAKRLSEATDRDASTIHRMLGYSAGGEFEHDEDDPLDADMVIVDEASMIDLMLFFHLLKAIRTTSHLLLVGDVDQLPSVGAGNVLRDVIDSGAAHVTRLDTIFRQREDSVIIVNAHRINHGQMPELNNRSTDFFFFRAEDANEAGALVVDIVANRLPTKFGVNPLEDVQVIAPMYRGPVGVDALNTALQVALNPPGRMAERKIGGRLFRVGDKVMQVKNNYDKDVFNGDIGRIRAMDFEERTLEVLLEERIIEYDFDEVDQLTHAFAISTHRSQGGEYPFVVLALHTAHYMMLQRNLLYTAITRARRTVVLVGMQSAVRIAVQNNPVVERYSGLLPRLRSVGGN